MRVVLLAIDNLPSHPRGCTLPFLQFNYAGGQGKATAAIYTGRLVVLLRITHVTYRRAHQQVLDALPAEAAAASLGGVPISQQWQSDFVAAHSAEPSITPEAHAA